VTLYISDQAEEFRIEISGRFADCAVNDAATAWQAALKINAPRRISVAITRMTGYDREGYLLLREFYRHGTHIVAGTPRSLLFLNQISDPRPTAQPLRPASKEILTMPPRAVASGE
jgi:hypothetical protein